MKAIFAEISGFSSIRESYLPDTTYAQLQQTLMDNPERGDVIPGCGGLRKLRIADEGRGKGKRGGARVIYLYVPEAKRFYMIDIYGKEEKADLSPADKKVLGQLAQAIKSTVIDEVRRRQGENET
jgi:mRNA-degrading endonuclease RelE of RelBE toxin-antitoxin system